MCEKDDIILRSQQNHNNLIKIIDNRAVIMVIVILESVTNVGQPDFHLTIDPGEKS